MNLPAVRLVHLARMTDDVGLFEHARYDQPRRGHGYCVDDAGRALVVLSRMGPAVERVRQLERNLAFVAAAARPGGRFVNRFRSGRWIPTTEIGDWWGRAVWGLATVAATDGGALGIRAGELVVPALAVRSPHPRALAHAALGAAILAGTGRARGAAEALLEDVADCLTGYFTSGRWQDHQLTYANGVLPHAVLATGVAISRPALVDLGLGLLEELTELQLRDGHLSVVPTVGGRPDPHAPRFDQQPLELHHLAEAAACAWEATGQPRWMRVVRLAASWFLGNNDRSAVLYDAATGAGYDGLTANGRNENRGAESTLSALATLQLARTAATASRSRS